MLVNQKKLLFLISVGAVLEYYDFAIFIYLAPYIGKSLIPVNNSMINLILSYAIFAIGAFFRPIGGMIFAHMGDTLGRNSTFIYTILCMAVPTLLIAFIPNVDQIGIWATVCLIALRICQGMAIGGEVPGSIVFGYEISKSQHRALNSSIVVMGTNIGFVLASLICTLLLSLHSETMQSWRLAFILGGCFGIISYFLRKKLTETPMFIEYKKSLVKEIVPIRLLFSKYTKPVLQMLGIGCFLASSLAVFTFYMPTYLSSFYHFPVAKIMQFNSYTIMLFICGSLAAGIFDKRFGKVFFLWFILLFTLAVIFLFYFYARLSLNQIFMIHIIVLFMVGIICGRLPVLAAAFFPVAVRYSGTAFIYNISFGIVAGSTQMLLTGLIKVTGLLWIPALYILFFSIIALITVLSIRHEQFVEYHD